VRSAANTRFLGILLDNLLDTTGAEPRGTTSLEEVAVVPMGRNVGSQRRCEAPTEQDIAIFVALPLADEDFAVFEIHVGHFDAAQLGNSHPRVEQQTEHQAVLNVLGPVNDQIEAAELLGGQDTREPPPLPGWPEITDVPHFLGNVSPTLVVQPGLSHDSSDLGDEVGFRLSILRSEIGRVLGC
jgi:hypothetical protein